jgi:hypothetical protein
MSAPKRTITIDTNIQSLSKRGKNKSVKNANTAATIRPKLKTNQFIRPSTLKKQLLARIKTHQQKKNTYSDATTTTTTLRDIRETKGNNAMSNDDNNHIDNTNTNTNTNTNNNSSSSSIKDNETFSQSLEYLQSLAVNRKDRKQKTKTQRTNMNMNTPTTIATGTTATSATITPSPQAYLPHEPHQQPQPQVFLNAFPTETIGTSTAPIIPQFPQLQLAQVAPPVAQLAPPPFESYVDNNPPLSPPIVLNSEPQWGCLKSGNKPTFRSFHNKTCKVSTTIGTEPNNNTNNNTNNNNNYTSESAPVVFDTAATTTTATTATTATGSDSESESERDRPDPVALSEVLYGSRQQRLNDYRNEQVKTDKKNIEPVIKIKQTKQRIVTKKYKLGKYTNKTGPVIGVLIKNVQTQRNVERKRNEMKHIPLDTIISRLHKKRLLKVGSSAPPDVLREMYESSMLAGDIENEGNDIALHNFLAGSTDNNDTTSS